MYGMSTREALVTATKQLLAEQGYVRTSPRDILVRSGAGQGSLYHHFRGKSDLVGAALDEVSAEMRAEADARLAGPDPFLAVLSWVTAPRQALLGCRLGRLVAEPILDDAVLSGPLAAYFSHVESRLRARLHEAGAVGVLSPQLDPAQLASALVAVVQGGYVLARSTADPDAMTRAQAGAAALLRSSRVDAAAT